MITRSFPALEWLAAMCSNIANWGEQIVRSQGYSSSRENAKRNTTAAAVPLTIDHWRREGKVKKGDRILATVFGSGYTWGTAVFQI